MTRVAVCGGSAVHEAVAALGLDLDGERPDVIVLEVTDPAWLSAAAAYPAEVPRIVIGGGPAAELARALGSPAPLLDACEPALLGPAIAAALPARERSGVRSYLFSSPSGGLGRTLLVAELALRLARTTTVAVLDLTGTGAAAARLGVTAAPWSDLEPLVQELTSEHLAVVASEAAPGLRVVGGAPTMPSVALAATAARAAAQLAQICLIDGPLLPDERTAALAQVVDRVIALCADERGENELLGSSLLPSGWVLAAGGRIERIGGREVLRTIPLQASAARAAGPGRLVGGDLGRACDEIAELISVDAGA